MDFTVNFSSKTKSDAIVGPNPPVMCIAVPNGWEHEIIFKFVKTASPPHAIPVLSLIHIYRCRQLRDKLDRCYKLDWLTVPFQPSKNSLLLYRQCIDQYE